MSYDFDAHEDHTECASHDAYFYVLYLFADSSFLQIVSAANFRFCSDIVQAVILFPLCAGPSASRLLCMAASVGQLLACAMDRSLSGKNFEKE